MIKNSKVCVIKNVHLSTFQTVVIMMLLFYKHWPFIFSDVAITVYTVKDV